MTAVSVAAAVVVYSLGRGFESQLVGAPVDRSAVW